MLGVILNHDLQATVAFSLNESMQHFENKMFKLIWSKAVIGEAERKRNQPGRGMHVTTEGPFHKIFTATIYLKSHEVCVRLGRRGAMCDRQRK